MNKQLSLYLDCLRFVAASLVFASHASSFTGGWLWQLGGMAHEAVVFFFVLSGFVIAYVIYEKNEGPFDYAINRFSRIYSVAIPSIFLTIILYYMGHSINPETFIELDKRLLDPTITSFSAVFFFNQSWVGIPFFSNLPYWSLGYEVLYYIFFGILIFTRGKARIVLLLCIILLMGPSILLYLPIWLMGVVCFRFVQKYSIFYLYSLLLFIISVFGITIFSLETFQTPINYFFVSILPEEFYTFLLSPADNFAADYVLALFVSLNFFASYGLGKHVNIFNRFFEPKIRWLASHTFALYLLHMPILFFVVSLIPYATNPILNFVVCWVGVPILIIIMSSYIEKTKYVYKVIYRSMYNKCS